MATRPGQEKRRWWKCVCDCGKEKIILGTSLVRKKNPTRSCGCLLIEQIGVLTLTHGATDSPTWRAWQNMVRRCRNPNGIGWRYYGGRGISVCERWYVFDNFMADMGPRPAGKSIGRIDNDKNYEPSNCRWETRVEQANNKRCNRILEWNGIRQTLTQWSRSIGISADTVRRRLTKMNWTIDEALTRPCRPHRRKTTATTQEHSK